MAILAGGALLKKSLRSAVPDSRLTGFLHLCWHGGHDGGTGIQRNAHGMVDIVRDSRGGQFDLYFCSPRCLRGFLNVCVDQLEAEMRRSRRVRRRRHA